MDPVSTSLTVAIVTGFANVAYKLFEKGVIDPLLEPTTEMLKSSILSGYRNHKHQKEWSDAVDSAIEDAARAVNETDAAKYIRSIRLEQITHNNNLLLRDEVMQHVILASSLNDARLVSDKLLSDLNLQVSQRHAVGCFLFYLRQHLYDLEEFRPFLDLAHQQNIENALRILIPPLLAIADTVVPTAKGYALQVQSVVSEWNPKPYLRYLASASNRLPLSTIDPEFVSPFGDKSLKLEQVYVELEVQVTKGKQPDFLMEVLRKKGLTPVDILPLLSNLVEKRVISSDDDVRKVTSDDDVRKVMSVVGEQANQRVVLLGSPGGGKSTFLKRLLYCLAMDQLEEGNNWLSRLSGWRAGQQFPVLVVMRELEAWISNNDTPRTMPTANVLWDYIKHDLQQRGFEECFRGLKQQLLEHGGIVVIDGLDEVPNNEMQRKFFKNVIEEFARATGSTRIIVTCRPYAYSDARWKLEGFKEYTLAPFNLEQIVEFVTRWYRAMAHTQSWSEDTTETKTKQLVSASIQPSLFPLAQVPLLLTLMATLHSSRGILPDDRADLYADCVALMLDYWQRSKVTVFDKLKESQVFVTR